VTEPARAPHRPRVVLVEDNPADAQLLALACEERGISVDLRVFQDGEAFLTGIDAGAVFPDLLIVDMNLPRMPGQSVIEAVRARPELRNIRIAVLTTSANPRDRAAAKQAGADSIYQKPHEWDQFCYVVAQIMQENLG
jgi:CheY-like chemotaxis protein